MPIFFKDGIRVLYIHIPKTGGTSIKAFFEANGYTTAYHATQKEAGHLNKLRLCSPQHMHSDTLKHLFRLNSFNYIFATVRDPLSRIISEYYMRRTWTLTNSPAETFPLFQQWSENALSLYSKNNFIHDNHIRPQYQFILDNCDIYKQEEGYDEDWINLLSGRSGLTFECKKIPRLMKATPAGTTESRLADKYEINPVTEELIRSFYALDYKTFQY